MAAKKTNLDFTNVKEGGNFSKKHMPVGDYLAKITKVEDAMPKEKSDKTPMWLFTVQLVQTPSATYPYYCKLQDNQLWKVRNLLVAAGINVPKKKVGVDPNKLVGKLVAVSLDDTEYNDKEQSEVGAIFSPKELDGDGADDVDDVDDDDEDEDTSVDTDDDDDEDEEEEPAPKKKGKKKKAPEPEPDEEDDEDEDDEDEAEGDAFDAMDRAQLRRAVRKAVPGTKISKSQSDDDLRAILRGADDEDEADDDEEDEDEPPKKSKKSKKAAKKAADDEDEDEIDIEDL